MVKKEPPSFMLVSFTPINLTYSDSKWWLDAEANYTYIYTNRFWFSSYQESNRGSVIMGDGTTMKILQKETINLKFTSGKTNNTLKCTNILIIRRNLLSSFLLI